jgi:hypothetical protein
MKQFEALKPGRLDREVSTRRCGRRDTSTPTVRSTLCSSCSDRVSLMVSPSAIGKAVVTDQEALAAAGVALFGERWQRPLAKVLNSESRNFDRRLRRWVTGEISIPGWVWGKLADEVDARRATLRSLAKQLRKRAMVPGNTRVTQRRANRRRMTNGDEERESQQQSAKASDDV